MSGWASRVATSFGLGDRLPAPGTLAGSLPVALLWWGLLAAPLPRAPLLAAALAAAVALIVVAVWAAGEEAVRRGSSDPGPVVVDEVVGQWLTVLVALPLLHLDQPRDTALAVVAAFFLFRAFDVVKPWPVNALERLPGGLGIVADDLAAGLLAGAGLAALGLWLGW